MIPSVNSKAADVKKDFDPLKDDVVVIKCPLCSLDAEIWWTDIGRPIGCCHVEHVFFSDVNQITVCFRAK